MAVYTEVSNEELEYFVSAYEIGKVISFKGIAEGVENSNYMLQTDFNRYILTIYEKRVKIEDLPFFLGLMNHLADKGIPCPTPLPGKDGHILGELSGKPAAIVTYLDGISPKTLTTHHCAQLGEAIARMHKASEDFPMKRGNDLRINDWRSLFELCREGANKVIDGLEGEIENELNFLETRWPIRLPEGVIHADIFPDNVFFLDNQLSGFIDFYFACNDWFAYEIAICLNAWCFEPDRQFNVTKASRLLSQYKKIRVFSEKELSMLPVLARGASIRFLLTRLYDWLNQIEGAFVMPKDPLEYLAKLRFHQSVKNPSAYGLE